ncbi:acyl- dehydrogenase [Pyrrhoderma noxium]|uniref:Acyl-dehydrogenase n=1 Tax=Pyrrhoderma noxium TaxID=2282107 RepID=A0A286UKU6_9AGAM|nr:acyl- dehydrogenase [Pyrrhoderma noxium]
MSSPAGRVPFGEASWVGGGDGDSLYRGGSHRRLRTWIREFLEKEIFPDVLKWEAEGVVPREVYGLMARKGLLLPTLPRKYRNGENLPADVPDHEWDLFHTVLINEELCRSPAVGTIFALTGGNNIGCPPILNYGSEEQKEYYLPKVREGKISFCLAVTEPGAGSDVAGISTTATPDPQDPSVFIVNGNKKWITNGTFADYATMLVRTSTSSSTSAHESTRTLSLLIVPLKTSSGSHPPGVTIRPIHVSGLSTSGTAMISLRDVRVPRKNVIGKEGEGFGMVMGNFNPERLMLASSALVLARTCLVDAWGHAMRRKTFGKKLVGNQVIRAKLASMTRALESTYAWYERIVFEIEQAAGRLDLTKDGTKDYAAVYSQPEVGARLALLKVQAGKTLEYLSREAQQILGGAGMTRDGVGARVEQISRDTRVFVVGGGSEEILDDLGVRLAMLSLKRTKGTRNVKL